MISGLATGGCSTSYQLGSMFGGEAEKNAQTASIPPIIHGDPTKMPPETDLALTKIAAAEVLGRGGKDASAPWENPQTGARGTVTPLAAAYTQDGVICRDFLASHVTQGHESWLQGEACRVKQNTWEVRRMKRWRNS